MLVPRWPSVGAAGGLVDVPLRSVPCGMLVVGVPRSDGKPCEGLSRCSANAGTARNAQQKPATLRLISEFLIID